MLTNMNKLDRVVRFVTGGLISALYVTDSMTGGMAHFLAVIGIIFVVTSISNYCPFYLVFETSTSENKQSR